jgi:hypothetical protein
VVQPLSVWFSPIKPPAQQTYQTAWEIETMLLAWLLLAVPLIFTLRSLMAAALVRVGSTWWLSAQMDHRDSLANGLAFMALAGLAVPFMVHLFRGHRDEGSTMLLIWITGGALTLAAIRIGVEAGDAWRLLLAGMSALCYLFGVYLRMDGASGAC